MNEDQGTSSAATRAVDQPTQDLDVDASTIPHDLPAPADAEFGRGRSLGRYLILRTLGVGGMGMVFLADDPELDRKVAVKLLRSEERSSPRNGQLRILAEAQAIAKLSHPNVVAVYDVGSFDTGVFLAMEYVEGPSLRRWLEAERTPDAILDVILATGRGLAAAHEAGLVHRDIKPENILVANDGRVRLVDFGLAELTSTRALASDVSRSSRRRSSDSEPGPHELVGTPRYMAPELFSGEEATPLSDQFALCATLFEALYRRPPYPSLDGHRWKRDFGEPPAAPSERTSVPPGLRPLLERGLSVDPSTRYRNLDEFLARLTTIRQRRKRRLTLATTAAVMGAGIVIGFTPARLVEQGPCASAAETMTPVWTEDARRTTLAAFEATGLPYATRAAAEVEPTLDQFVDSWTEQRMEVCRATVVDGTQSGAMMDLRVACLERRRTHLVALLDAFARADEAVVLHAGEAARSLPSVSECADPRVLAQIPPIPTDAMHRARVQDSRRGLAELSAARRSGRLHHAASLAQDLRPTIAQLDYTPVLAELDLEVGRVHAALGRHASAEQHLRQALVAAARGRYERVRGEAWLALARELGVGQKRFEAALEATRAAEASLSTHRDQPDTEPRLVLVRADLAQARDNRTTARALYQSLLDRPDVDIERHDLLTRVGTVAHSRTRAIVVLREALALRRSVLGPTHPDTADTLLALARNLADAREFDEAIALTAEARHIREQLFASNTVAVAQTYSARAYIEARRGRTDEAARHFERASEMIREDPDHVEFDLGSAIMNTGVMYSRLGRHAEARRLHKQVLEIFERTDPEHPRIALPLMNTAAAYEREGAIAQAIEWYERAITHMIGGSDPGYAVARVELVVAQLHIAQERYADAEAYIVRAEMRLEHQVGGREHNAFRHTWDVRAQLELARTRWDAAAEAAAESLRLHLQVRAPDDDREAMGRARFIRAQARMAVGRTEEALALAQEAAQGLDGEDHGPLLAEVHAWTAEHAKTRNSPMPR